MKKTMNKSYAETVKQLTESGDVILKKLTPSKVHLIHMTLGISSEAGELLDAIKKHTIYDKPLDRETIVEELSDLEFYMEGLRAELNITRAETIATIGIITLTTQTKPQ